jgi:multiple sugar transport system substrate-binding protein
MRSIVDEHKIAPRPEGGDAWIGFRQGRVAMALEGIYMLADLEKTAGLEYGGAPVPQFGPVRASWAGSHMLCLPAKLDSRYRQAAWKFIHYLSDSSLDWAAGGQVPARKSRLYTERFRSMRVQSAFARQLPYVRYEPPSTRMTELSPFITAAIEAAMLGLKSPESAMSEASARMNRVLARP